MQVWEADIPDPGSRVEAWHPRSPVEHEGRETNYVYRNVKLAADLLVFSDLLTEVGSSQPFVLDPAFDTEAAIFVRLDRDSVQRQDPDLPAATNATQRQIDLELLEHIA